MIETTTATVSETTPLDLRDRCVLCPEHAPDPKASRHVTRTLPSPGAPVAWHGAFRPAGLYASARGVDYGLCGEHGRGLVHGSPDVHKLERVLLKLAAGHFAVPLTPARQ